VPSDGAIAARHAAAAVVVVLALATGSAVWDLRAPGPVRFEDVTLAYGLTRLTASYDAAVADYDGDGWLDLYVGNHGSPAVLMRREGPRFVDVVADAGLDAGGDQHGTAWADYDNDGDLDLYVTLGADRGRGAKQNRLYRNDGGRFADVGAAAGVADPHGRGRAVAWLDVDDDGWVDLLVGNLSTPTRLLRNRADGTFEDVSEAWDVARHAASRVAWTDVDADGRPDLLLAGTPHGLRLLHNDGARFVDVTAAAHMEVASARGMAFGDYDNDGDLDLYVSRGAAFADVVRPLGEDRLGFVFFASGAEIGVDFDVPDGTPGVRLRLFDNGNPIAAAGVWCGTDVVAAEWPFRCRRQHATRGRPSPAESGFVVWRDPPARADPSRPGWHLRWYGEGDHHLSGIVDGGVAPRAVGFAPAPRGGGVLWRGRGAIGVERVELPAMAHDGTGQAVAWADVDGDGWLDLYVVDSGLDLAPGRNRLFLNNRLGGFVSAGSATGATPTRRRGRPVGAVFWDVDRDGRQDLFLTNGWGVPPFDRGEYRLVRNVTPKGAWLLIELEGRRSNRQGLGAWIRVVACARAQARYYTGGASYFSQSALPVHVGLGSCREPADVTVRWPSGVVQHLAAVPLDRVLRVREARR
jgi:hypothetical protein